MEIASPLREAGAISKTNVRDAVFVAVVPKDNGYGDFYTSDGGQVIFTNTQERTIQNISVDICDADGSASRVVDSCCVIFKVQKEIQSNKNVLTNILKK